MKARELWESMARGNSLANISAAQRSYLIDLAKEERRFNVNDTAVVFDDGTRVHIRPAYVRVGGYGGTIGKKPTGRFVAEVFYLIKFKTTGLTEIRNRTDLDYIRREGHEFEVVKPTLQDYHKMSK